jgi:hypothetical protein
MGDPTRDRFARQVAIALRVAGGSDIEYDQNEFCLRFKRQDGAPWVANLGNVFAEWGSSRNDDLAGRIRRFATMLATPTEEPTDWSSVAGRLRPVLSSPQMARWGGMEGLAREFQPFVNEMVVIDHPDKMQYVVAGDPADWGVSAAAVFDQARANLATGSYGDLRTGPPDPNVILRLPETGSDYWVSHLLIPGWLAGFEEQFDARPVAFLADRSGLTVVADRPDVVEALLELTGKEYLDATRPVSPQAYTVDDAGRVVPYAVPRHDPLWNAVHRSELMLATREYAAQYREYHPSDEGSLAELRTKEEPDGRMWSIAVWGEDVDTLLPRADYVSVIDSGYDFFLVPWESLVRTVRIEKEPGWDPPRYRARNWPNPLQLAALRTAATQP